MRKRYITLFVLLSSLIGAQAAVIQTFDTRHAQNSDAGTTVVGQTTIQAGNWFGATIAPGVLDANLQDSYLAFGGGFDSNVNLLQYRFVDFGVNSTTAAAALAAGEYLTFTVAPKGGYQVDIDSIDLQLAWQNGSRTVSWALYSSLDGFTSPIDSDTLVDASRVAITNVTVGATAQTGPVEFRLALGMNNAYEWIGVSDYDPSSTWPDYGKAIVVHGSVSVVPVTSIPSTPTALSATAVSPNVINLGWTDTSDNEFGFIIERGPNSSSFTTIATNAANSTSFSDSGLSPSTEYFYRVTAYNTMGPSTNNPIDSATTLVQVAPDAPAALMVTGTTSNSIDLAWGDVAGEDGFIIERGADTNSFVSIATNAADNITYSDTGLLSETEYFYRVSAYNGTGSSTGNPVVSGTTLHAIVGGVIMTFETRHDENSSAGTTTNNQPTIQAGNWFGATTLPGILDANLADAYLAFGGGFQNNVNLQGGRFVDFGVNNTTAAAALAAGEYLTFTVTPKTGYQVDIDTIALQIAWQNATRTVSWALYSSLDGFTTPIDGNTLVSPDRNDIVNVFVGAQAQATPVEFRLALGMDNTTEYIGIQDVGSTFPDYGKAIQIYGTTEISTSGDPYLAWNLTYGLTGGDTNLMADVEPDGLNNLLEYALGGNPTNDDAAAVTPASFVSTDSGTDYLNLVYKERTDDPSIIYRVGTKANLALDPTWNTNDVSSAGESAVSGNYKTVTNRTATAEAAKFLGLEVEK